MSKKLIRKLVVFNENEEHQRELLEWCSKQSNNFSGFMKHILSSYKNGSMPQTGAPVSGPVIEDSDNNSEIMDIFG